MKRGIRLFALGFVFLLLLGMVGPAVRPAHSASAEAAVAPKLHDGKKWRIGYVETDPFGNYAGTLNALVKGLEKIGWLRDVSGLPYQVGQADSKSMWEWLTTHDTGPYIEFVKDAHYSLIDGPDVGDQLLARLKDKHDLDLVIAMGTLSGTLLSVDANRTPTMVFSSSNAVTSGIIKSVDDSGRDNLWAHMDPQRYERQVEVFYDLFSFKKLGMMYEDSDAGRVYAAVDDVQQVAREKGFQIISRNVKEPVNDKDKERYYRDLTAAANELAGQIDAMYLTYGVWDLKDLSRILQPFYEHHIPVFSQLGSEEVEAGALLSLSRANFSGIGQFGAENIAKIFNGTLPRKLPQVYGDTPSIVLNLKVADRIGYRPPFDILLAADEIYTDIDSGDLP